MIDFLLGVPGKLKAINDYLTTYWTTTRAAKVDNLDAAVTSRAAAATALSTATWTGTMAGYLTGPISGRLGSIKAIYTGTITITALSATATITAVDLTRSICLFNGCASGSSDLGSSLGHVALTNTTTVTANRLNNVGTCDVRYTVIEFNA